jgi:hypothetical protein
MSGAEAAGLVIGIISGIIAVIDATINVYDAATDASGLPEVFRDVAKRLPLVQKTLQAVQGYLERNPNDASCDGMKLVLEGCKEKANRLATIFEKVVPPADASRTERYLLATRNLGKGDTVESLMKGILDDVHLLTGNRITNLPTRAEIEGLIRAAMADVSAVPPSLPAGIPAKARRNRVLLIGNRLRLTR